MLKHELEEKLGYEITQEGYDELNKMYMSCNLDKNSFAKLIKSGAKCYKISNPMMKKIYRGILIEYNPFVGMYEIKNDRLSLIQAFFQTIDQAIDLIKRYCY